MGKACRMGRDSGAIAAIIVGFAWGGWVTGGTAGKMETASAEAARSKHSRHSALRRRRSSRKSSCP